MNLGYLKACFIGFIINRIIRDLTGLSYALGSAEYLALSSKFIIAYFIISLPNQFYMQLALRH